jgi:hypothetical protein
VPDDRRLSAPLRYSEGRSNQNVEITFSSDANGSLIRVRRGGSFFGVIFLRYGVYRFHTGEEAGADLEDTDLEQLKTKIREQYGRET